RFAGGVAGSAIGVAVFAHAGWRASAAVGAGLYAIAICVWCVERRYHEATDSDTEIDKKPVRLGARLQK
ncbi:MAG: hypothetical protein QOD26_3273, partial [Betaproteobacteria bacterium]|nr:hypothetical protein [Betaproteobacteria bacterium]